MKRMPIIDRPRPMTCLLQTEITRLLPCHATPRPGSGEKTQPTFASISLRLVGEGGDIDVTAQAHRVWSTGAISGYDSSSARRPERRESEASVDGSTERLRAGVDDAQFVDDSTASSGDDGGWMGSIAMEELPGGGLHRQVRFLCTVEDAVIAVCVKKSRVYQACPIAVHNPTRWDRVA